jgi:uncharacterized protein DUF928
MRTLKLAVVLIVGIALGMQGLSIAADVPQIIPALPDTIEKGNTKSLASGVMPQYRPPQGSVPGGRLKGGIRGGKEAPVLQVLAPNHVGLTRYKQPTLYWYLSKPVSYPIEFTLVDSRKIPPLVETRLPTPTEGGVQSIQLKDYAISLEVGVPYRWFVSVTPDPENPSKDITAGSIIERVGYLEGMVIHSVNEDDPNALAAAGLWYDAIKAISAKIEASPGDPFYRRQRAFLLEQVGLPEVAEYDLKRTRTP